MEHARSVLGALAQCADHCSIGPGRHLLRELAPAAVAQVLRNPGRTKRMIADSSPDAGAKRPATNHPLDIGLSEGIGRQLPSSAARTAK